MSCQLIIIHSFKSWMYYWWSCYISLKNREFMSASNIHNVTYYDILVAFERQDKLKEEWQQFGLPLQNLLAFLLAIGLGNFEGFGELWVLYCVMIIPFQLSMTTTLFYPQIDDTHHHYHRHCRCRCLCRPINHP